VEAWQLQWELGSYSGSLAVTVETWQLQWELGSYSGSLAVTVGARQLQRELGSYSGNLEIQQELGSYHKTSYKGDADLNLLSDNHVYSNWSYC